MCTSCQDSFVSVKRGVDYLSFLIYATATDITGRWDRTLDLRCTNAGPQPLCYLSAAVPQVNVRAGQRTNDSCSCFEVTCPFRGDHSNTVSKSRCNITTSERILTLLRFFITSIYFRPKLYIRGGQTFLFAGRTVRPWVLGGPHSASLDL